MYSLRCKSPHYVMMSSDYSQQEPKLTAFIASPRMCEAYKQGKDIYAEVASVSFGVPYEKCLEFHPETHEYQPDGKQRRTEAKSILLGINYGRSVKTIGEQLYGSRDDMTDDEKTKAAQHVYDSVMNAFPDLKGSIAKFQYQCSKLGYTETILGRRRHIPDMTLPKYEFVPMKNYVNPNVDPLDPSTLAEVGKIPASKIKALTYEFSQFKYRGQVFKRTKQLAEQEHIKVIDNTRRITDASRQVFNSRIQGSAAEETKMALLKLHRNARWHEIGGRLLDVVHDECIAEVPGQYAEEGGKILSTCMVDAANFLPFPSKCDVETTYRWYGESVDEISAFDKPDNIEDKAALTESNIKWIQIRLAEMEYLLPVFKDENGDKPNGIAAHGINGVQTDDMWHDVEDYIKTRGITKDQFVDAIDKEVIRGIR